MRKEGEATLKPGQAALIITYGNTTRKHRPLDRDLFLLGRSPTCDVALASPEVAAVHCILHRTGDGWNVRDCSGGRHATRLNGRTIQEEALRDCDVLQIGAFSFELRLPSARPTPIPGTKPVVEERSALHLKRLQRSRRNLVRLALRLRSRALKSNPQPPTLAELERQAETLRALQREYQNLVQDYERRLDELEKAEREVCDERAALERECAERRTQLDEAEYDLSRRQAKLARAPVIQAVPAIHDAVAEERARKLDQRSRELKYFAAYLQRCRRQAPEQSPKASRSSEVEHWRRQCEQLQANWAVLEAQFQQIIAELKAERDRARAERDALASSMKEVQAKGDLRDRLSQLRSLRQGLVGSSPSAPGEQRRESTDLMANPVR
jgi:pSer/pThr/pTyr-binding forkhead associated (FHA) protein